MRFNRKHFSIAKKKALDLWRFKEDDLVMVMKGRHAKQDIEGHKGKVGRITKVIQNARNLLVYVEGVTVCTLPGQVTCMFLHFAT